MILRISIAALKDRVFIQNKKSFESLQKRLDKKQGNSANLNGNLS